MKQTEDFAKDEKEKAETVRCTPSYAGLS